MLSIYSYTLNKKYFKKGEKERSLYTILATCDMNNSSLLNNKRFLECNRGSDEAAIQSVHFAKNHSRSNKNGELSF